MKVTHHKSPIQFKTYVKKTKWIDLRRPEPMFAAEQESYISRSMNLWSSGHHGAFRMTSQHTGMLISLAEGFHAL